jgi:stress responsive alpha/beta barrel protein
MPSFSWPTAFTLFTLASCQALPGASSDHAMLVHSVYFTLRDDTPAARAQLVESCYRHLSPIEGIAFFAAGTRDEELVREVNDLEFDVALTVVFHDRAAHDRYQPDERHQRFIAENKDAWAQVRVFDSSAR